MLGCPCNTNNPATGACYFLKGACLIWHPKLRPYLLVPMLINLVLFVLLTLAVVKFFGTFTAQVATFLPILGPLMWVAWVVIGIMMMFAYSYSFNFITNIIAAPFYGILSERAELLACGNCADAESFGEMLPRVLKRESIKIYYFVSRGILITLIMILLGTLPIIQLFAPMLLGLAWGAWTMTIQYVDYPADNHQTNFSDLRKTLWKKPFSSSGFGLTVLGFTLIPIVNIFVMPAAVVGGTLFWTHELKKFHKSPIADSTGNSNKELPTPPATSNPS